MNRQEAINDAALMDFSIYESGTYLKVEIGGTSVITVGTILSVGATTSVTDGTLNLIDTVASLTTGTLGYVYTIGTINSVANAVVASGTLGLVNKVSTGTIDRVTNASITDLLGVSLIKSSFGTFLQTASKIDTICGAAVQIEHAHSEIHDGDHFFVEGYNTLGSGGTLAFCLTTPIDSTIHLLFEIQTTGQTELNSYENATWGTGGTAKLALNSNRESAILGTSIIVINPTNIVTGTTLLNSQAWGVTGNASQRAGGQIRSESEIILKSGTARYCYVIKSNSADNLVSYHGNWYKELV